MEPLIRAFSNSDCEDVADLMQQPNCVWGTMQIPYQSRDEMKRKLENPPDGAYRLVAVVEEKAVAMVAMFPQKGRRAHAASIGLFVHDDYQNQGLGSRLMSEIVRLADQWLNLRRLELSVYTDNDRAIHLYKKHGFEIEGTFRQYAFRDGAYVDAFTMARLREANR